MASMPAYDPNSFSDGIGRTEWRMLSEDQRQPLAQQDAELRSTRRDRRSSRWARWRCRRPASIPTRRSTARAATGSATASSAASAATARSTCAGPSPRAATPISTRWATASATTASRRWRSGSGLGQKFDLPVVSQSFGTVPDSAWKARKFKDNPRIDRAARLDRVGHAERLDRPGLPDPQSAPAGGDGGAHRLGPRRPADA